MSRAAFHDRIARTLTEIREGGLAWSGRLIPWSNVLSYSWEQDSGLVEVLRLRIKTGSSISGEDCPWNRDGRSGSQGPPGGVGPAGRRPQPPRVLTRANTGWLGSQPASAGGAPSRPRA